MSATRLLADLASRCDRPHVALVGHEPDLGGVAARLLGARRPLEFKKGAICRIDVDSLPLKRPGRLRWFVTPRMLRRLGG
jgi:phosphohistidine phosphatase SixA